MSAALSTAWSAILHSSSRRLAARLAGPLLALWLAPALAATEPGGFLEPEAAFRLEVLEAGAARVRLAWTIAPGHYLYRDRMQVRALPGGAPLAVRLPPGSAKDDENFGVMEVYHDAVTLEASPDGAAEIEVGWQGCAEAGLCYPPQTRRVSLGATRGEGAAGNAGAAGSDGAAGVAGAVGAREAGEAPATAVVPPTAAAAPQATAPGQAAALGGASLLAGSDSELSRQLGERPLGAMLALFFVLGLALAFTPCMLPMLPVVSSVVVGSAAAPRRALARSLAFVLPMAATYAALGVAAAAAGAPLQALLQSRGTSLALAGLYVVLALGMFGLFTLQLPAAIRDRLDAASRRRPGGSVAGAAALGVLSALLMGPCMTAPLAGALLYIARSGDVARGAAALFALGLGLGAPMLLATTAGARLLPRPGAWMEGVKVALGFALLATAAWTLERAVPAPLALLSWGALLLGAAATLLHAARGLPQAGPAVARALAARTVAAVAGLWGAALVIGAAGGAREAMQPLAFAMRAAPGSIAPASIPPASIAPAFEPVVGAEALEARLAAARARGQATLVDFYADWCTSCQTIEREVFGDAQVRAALAGMVLLRADVTAHDAASLGLMRTHEVLGPPTVLLVGADGRERRAARLVGEFGVDALLDRLAAVTQPRQEPRQEPRPEPRP